MPNELFWASIAQLSLLLIGAIIYFRFGWRRIGHANIVTNEQGKLACDFAIKLGLICVGAIGFILYKRLSG